MSQERKYPSKETCMSIMKEHDMLPNIVDHSIQVMNVALAILNNLNNPGEIDRDLIISSALLHDIAKTRTIYSGEMRHDLIGGEIARDMGYPEIAEIIESHVVFNDFNFDGSLEEREIIFYADKRVMHDTIVSIDDRVDDLVDRYGKNEKIAEMILDNKKFILRVEDKIVNHMNCDIERALRNARLVQS